MGSKLQSCQGGRDGAEFTKAQVGEGCWRININLNVVVAGFLLLSLSSLWYHQYPGWASPKITYILGMVAYAFNPYTQEAESGGSLSEFRLSQFYIEGSRSARAMFKQTDKQTKTIYHVPKELRCLIIYLSPIGSLLRFNDTCFIEPPRPILEPRPVFVLKDLQHIVRLCCLNSISFLGAEQGGHQYN